MGYAFRYFHTIMSLTTHSNRFDPRLSKCCFNIQAVPERKHFTYVKVSYLMLRGSLRKAWQMFYFLTKNVAKRETKYVRMKSRGVYLCYHRMGVHVRRCTRSHCVGDFLTR
jgi:hypothetical protein